MEIIKKTIFFALAHSGFHFLFRWLCQKFLGSQITILYSHNIIDKSDRLYAFLKILDYFTVNEFERKIKYLNRHYKFISLREVLEYLKQNCIPNNVLALTFDDGYRSIYSKAFPILKKYNIPFTVFISTSSINDQNILWHDRLILAIGSTKKREISISELSDKTYKINSLKGKKMVHDDLCQYLKKLVHNEKEIFLDNLTKAFDIDECAKLGERLMLNWDEIKEMYDSGLVEFGSHTVTHPILTKISIEQAEKEICQSKKIISKYLGEDVKYFAYPNGDYNLEIENIVKSCGYEAAFSTDMNFRNCGFEHFSLGRQGFIHEPFYIFATRISGIPALLKEAKHDIEKNHPWLFSYGLAKAKSSFGLKNTQAKHVFLCICDHYEPLWEGVNVKTGLNRVKKWYEKYPEMAEKYVDSDGCHPKHTFFYPIEEYRSEYLDLLADLCHEGYGEVEIHLHHNDDTPENMRRVILKFKDTLFNTHGLLSCDKETGEVKYGFIHGNWALDNSRPDGTECGINNEIEILKETGCYADFTMPSAPDVTQTTKINSIYYAVDNPVKPKSHNSGINAEKDKFNPDGLLMVQGPLMLNWKRRKWKIFPQIENSDISYGTWFDYNRLRLWLNANIHVKNAPDYIFIKLHVHGCQDKNLEYLFKNGFDSLFSLFINYFKDNNCKFHFVTAREMVNVIKSLENNYLESIDLMKNYKIAFDPRGNRGGNG